MNVMVSLYSYEISWAGMGPMTGTLVQSRGMSG